MLNLMRCMIRMMIFGLGMLLLCGSCGKREEPTSGITRTVEEEDNGAPEISFGMESDSLEEDVEEVTFNSKEWDEEESGVDL